MFEFQLEDAASILSVPQGSLNLSLPRALRLLAIAMAPSPGSRYQPGSSWTAAKYATAIDPRILATGPQLAVANAGIQDLDPHQKTVLADDLGVALSLAAIDRVYGIDGLSDCYGLWLTGELTLVSGGKHRRMPDFVLLLQKPLSGSKVILLECKGSTLAKSADYQLEAACGQLNNVSALFGSAGASQVVPRVAIASKIKPGALVVLYVGDPPEIMDSPKDIETKLRASYVALELAALGDIAAAEAVRKSFGLPSWSRFSVRNELLRSSPILGLNQEVMATAPELKRLSAKLRSVFDPTTVRQLCLIHARLILGPSQRAIALRQNPSDQAALIIPTAKIGGTETPEQSEPLTDRKGRREIWNSADGSRSELITEVLRAV